MGSNQNACQPCTSTQSEEPTNVDQLDKKAADQLLSPSDEQAVINLAKTNDIIFHKSSVKS